MGEVYRATDTNLSRQVAIKVLPASMAADAERLARFDREAKTLASLSHPNIAAIYGLERSQRQTALVMELVEGSTLAERIAQSPISIDEALAIAKQITEALEAAHEQGIVHRDLKPANIKVRADGTVKVLDFGLAKAMDPATPVSKHVSELQTVTSPAVTRTGVILGTAAYMSPEQARGKPLDTRTDMWAFGCVLFEMLTGRRAFVGEDVSESLAAVLKDDPDWSALPLNTAGPIRTLLRRCLEKDRKRRLNSAAVARLEIEDAMAEPAAVPSSSAAPARRSIVPWAAAAVATLGLAALAFVHLLEVTPVAPLISASMNAPEGTMMAFAGPVASGTPELSPDGKWIVFGARTEDNGVPLWIRALSSAAAQMLTGTDGATFPFWSPDSRYVGFFQGGKLKKIDIGGGPAVAIAEAPNGRGGSWSSAGFILFAPNTTSPLFGVAASGGAPTRVTSLEATESVTHRFPSFLPDGRHFLFHERSNRNATLRIGALGSFDTVDIGSSSSHAVYSEGHLLFLREDTLMAQPFDPDRLTVQGEAVPVAAHVSAVLTGVRKGVFSASGTGLLAYHARGSARHALSWMDRGGKVVGMLGEPGTFESVQLSPDRKSVAVSSVDASGNEDIWIYDIARNLRTHFTFAPEPEGRPIWSPDGTAIVWHNLSDRKLRRKSIDGNGPEEVLFDDPGVDFPTSWSPDGKFLLFTRASADVGQGVWMLPMLSGAPGTLQKPATLVDTALGERWGAFSPDGRWVAYQSNESQQDEIFVVPFPGPGGKRQISTAGGTFPRWRHDGKEIFYVGPDATLMAAEVTLNASSIDVGQVRPLGIAVVTTRGFPYDVSLDGRRILVVTEAERTDSTPLTLVQNWTAILKK
jgi:Tol biopolymer transport system component